MIRQRGMIFLVVVWFVTLALGTAWLLKYQGTPGQAAVAAKRWPKESALVRKPGRYTLILFLHPYCPCSQISREELHWIVSRSRSRVDAHILLVCPPGAPASWKEDSSLSFSVDPAIASPSRDTEAREATIFGARTSGQVFLYDPSGTCVFQGGITAGRGHAGDNIGRCTVLEWLTHGTSAQETALVYGCPLMEEESFAEGGR